MPAPERDTHATSCHQNMSTHTNPLTLHNRRNARCGHPNAVTTFSVDSCYVVAYGLHSGSIFFSATTENVGGYTQNSFRPSTDSQPITALASVDSTTGASGKCRGPHTGTHHCCLLLLPLYASQTLPL